MAQAEAKPGRFPAPARLSSAAREAAATPPPHSPRAPRAVAPLAARRAQARLWGAVILATIISHAWVALYVIPHPPPGLGFRRIPMGRIGITPPELASLLAQAAAFSAALLLLQERVLRARVFASSPREATEATFFLSSIVVRAAFATGVALHLRGPPAPRALAAALGGGAPGEVHKLPLIALFLAAYVTDLVQMKARPGEFSASYPRMVIPHHWLSLGWFAAWLVLAAPRGPGGVPAWNTAILYLTCCVPIHAFKLVTCFHRPAWTPLAVLPVLIVHWLLLIAVQGYFFTACPASEYGCWYPGSISLMLGGWGMVVFTLDARFNSITEGGSGYLGARISFYDIWPLLTGRDPAAKSAVGRAAAAAKATGAAVTAEVVLAPREKCAGPGAGELATGSAAKKWSPACVAALEQLGAIGEAPKRD